MRAAENPVVITEITAALVRRWGGPAAPLSADASAHAAIIAGMYAAMATEPEVADYVLSVERAFDRRARADVAFAAELLRVALRLDEVAGRPPA